MKGQFYIVDADVLITAKNRYYAFDLCPGFWESLIYHHQEGRIYSIIPVRTEVFAGRQTEDLVQWAKGEVPQAFFRIVGTEDVMEAYNEIVEWVTGHERYHDEAKTAFSSTADAWLAAFARVHNAIVVTNEQSSPKSRRAVKLPDVCNEFNVEWVDTFMMLRSLGVEFDMNRDDS